MPDDITQLFDQLERTAPPALDPSTVFDEASTRAAKRQRRNRRILGTVAASTAALLGVVAVAAWRPSDGGGGTVVAGNVSTTTGTATPPHWTLSELGRSLPNETTVAGLDDGIISWGGFDRSTGKYIDTGARYDITRRRWRELPASPLAGRTDAQAATSSRGVVFIGGHNQAGNLVDGAYFDVSDEAWSTLGSPPSATSISTAAIVRDVLFVSGTDSQNAPQLWRYELAANGSWDVLEHPFGRDFQNIRIRGFGPSNLLLAGTQGVSFEPGNERLNGTTLYVDDGPGGTWRRYATTEPGTSIVDFTTDAEERVIATTLGTEVLYRGPADQDWHEARVPLPDFESATDVGVVAAGAVVWNCQLTSAYSTDLATWTKIDPPRDGLVLMGPFATFPGQRHFAVGDQDGNYFIASLAEGAP